MPGWDRAKIGLVFAGVVLLAAMINAAVREADVVTAIMSAAFAAACLGGAAWIHRYR